MLALGSSILTARIYGDHGDRRVRARLRSDRSRLVPVERPRAARADQAAGAAAAPEPPGDRPVGPGVHLLDRPHTDRLRGSPRWRPTSSSTGRSTSRTCSCRRSSSLGRLPAVHEPRLEHRRRPVALSAPAGSCSGFAPTSSPPTWRLAAVLEHLHADRLGPDPRHRRLLGHLAHAPPARLAQVDPLVGADGARSAAAFAPFRRSFGSGSRSRPGALATGVSDQVGTWILGAFGSLAAVGRMESCLGAQPAVHRAELPLAEMVFPTLVERHAGEDRLGFDRALVDSLRYVAGGNAASRRGRGGRRGRDHGPLRAGILAGVDGAGDRSASCPRSPRCRPSRPMPCWRSGGRSRPPWLAGARLAATVPLTVVLTLSMGVTGTALGVTLGFTPSARGPVRGAPGPPLPVDASPLAAAPIGGARGRLRGRLRRRSRHRCGHPRVDRPAGEPGGGVPCLCRLHARGGGNSSARSRSRVSDRTKGGPELEVGHPACDGSPTVGLRKNERHAAPI